MTADLAHQPITISDQIGPPTTITIIITVIGISQITTIMIRDVSPVINLDI